MPVTMANAVWEIADYRKWSLKEASVQWYIANVRSSVGLSYANRSKVIYLLQPQMTWSRRKRTAEEQEYMDKISSRMPPIPKLAPEWFALVRPQFEAIRSELHDGKKIWIEDASAWLDDVRESVYNDYNHYNENGQKILGERIADIIIGLWNTASEHASTAHTFSAAPCQRRL